MKTLISKCIFLLLLVISQSCSKGDNDKCHGICTEEYRTISVTIEDNEGNPVALDNFVVTNIENGTDLTREVNNTEFQIMRERGSYPLFGDEYYTEYFQRELEINFMGFLNGEEVVSADYKVGANCCHVYHVSGNLNIILE